MWCLFFYIQKEFSGNKRVDDNGCLLIESNEPDSSILFSMPFGEREHQGFSYLALTRRT